MKPHQCTYCIKSFSVKSKLWTHMLVHSRKKSHQCSRCEKTFSESSSLNIHMVLHIREKPHKCTQCAKIFHVPSSLKTHMMVHVRAKSKQWTVHHHVSLETGCYLGPWGTLHAEEDLQGGCGSTTSCHLLNDFWGRLLRKQEPPNTRIM